jgi:hypothetical protein
MSWDEPISESQIGLVRRLADERREALTAKGQWPADIETVQQWMASEVVWGAGQSVHTLDRRGARVILDMLFAIKVEVVTPDDYVGPEADRIIQNRYANRCALCGQTVAVESGFASLVGGKWITTHRDGDCGQAPASTGIDLTALDQYLTKTGHGNRTAYFAHPAHQHGPVEDTRQRIKVVLNEKSQWLSVFDANTYAGEEAGFGKKFGSQRPGSGDYHGDILTTTEICANEVRPFKVTDLIEAIVANPAGGLSAYGHLTGTCSICRRPLEDAESVARGIGPICADKVGL